MLERYLAELEPPEETLETTSASGLHPAEAWVAEHHLALVPGVESFRPELIRWDSLRLFEYVESGDTSTSPPAAFTMFNLMKQSYILARNPIFAVAGMAETALRRGWTAMFWGWRAVAGKSSWSDEIRAWLDVFHLPGEMPPARWMRWLRASGIAAYTVTFAWFLVTLWS
jgi:hypothetical protein